MKYLLDTDVVVAALKGQAVARTFVLLQTAEGLGISLVTYGEVYEGIYYGADLPRQQQVFRAFLRSVPVLPLHKPIMKRFARLRGKLRQAGMLIGDADTLVAATALHYDLTLVTGNVRHFNRIPGLPLLTPS